MPSGNHVLDSSFLAEWPVKYPECGQTPQSPINIKETRDLSRKIRFVGYDASITFIVENNLGHGGDTFIQEPILRLLNLQLQRQRSTRLERFSK
jgi:hypothetical protein